MTDLAAPMAVKSSYAQPGGAFKFSDVCKKKTPYLKYKRDRNMRKEWNVNDRTRNSIS